MKSSSKNKKLPNANIIYHFSENFKSKFQINTAFSKKFLDTMPQKNKTALVITYHQCGKTIYHLSSIGFDIINGSHLTFLPTALVKGRVAGIEILGVQIILSYAHSVGKPLKMHDLPLSKELDRITNVGIVNKSQNVVIGRASLLLCYYHVFATFFGVSKTRNSLDL